MALALGRHHLLAALLLALTACGSKTPGGDNPPPGGSGGTPIAAFAAPATVAAGTPALFDASASQAADGSARILRYTNTEIDIDVDAPDGGFLVVNDVWHPWWRADADGQPVDILRANVLFRAVQVGPGTHRVHFAFEPLQGAWEELKEKIAGVSEAR